MTTRPAPLCWDCIHFGGYDQARNAAVCDAFPNGMPREIFDGHIDHREPYPGDGGIQFERRKDLPPADVIIPT